VAEMLLFDGPDFFKKKSSIYSTLRLNEIPMSNHLWCLREIDNDSGVVRRLVDYLLFAR